MTYRYQEEISTLESLRRSENVPDSEFKLKNSLEVHNIFRRCATKILSPENKSQIFVATELITQVADAVVQVSAIEYHQQCLRVTHLRFKTKADRKEIVNISKLTLRGIKCSITSKT